MKFPKMIPALADLTQDIAGPVPVELLRDWASGVQDLERAEAILGPFRIRGTVVATDTSGLSLMTQERDLLDVLALVSTPKEIVHALGVEVGGRPVGTWVADNTEMFYPAQVAVQDVIEAMLEAQARIAVAGEVRIGMCVHRAEFYEIGGGLYGPEADAVEYLAERFAAPGEILVTQTVSALLDSASLVRLSRRPELDIVHAAGVFNVLPGPRRPTLGGDRIEYPHGFTDDVFRALREIRSVNGASARARIYESLLHDRFVVFATRDRRRAEGGTITALLDSLVGDLALDAIVRQVPGAFEHVASLGAGLAILTFEDAARAIEVAVAIRNGGIEMGLPLKLGVDAGPVLLIARQHGPSGISGDPVNIASKISEDVGLENMVTITTRAAASMPDLDGAIPFSVRISRVDITGVRL